MGELLLCNHAAAAVPYYLEPLSVHIYSMEELCYLMEKNLYLLDEAFFREELFLWMEKELGKKELAEGLRECRKKENFPVAAALIMEETHYCSDEAAERVQNALKEMQKKSSFECRKIKADRLMENKKYRSAVSEYRLLLQMEEECKKNPVLCGNIWHNLGTAFAGLFLFEEAAGCFRKAYSFHQNQGSLECAMAAYRCLGNAGGMERLMAEYGMTEEEKKKICGRVEMLLESEEAAAFEAQLDEWLGKAEAVPEDSGLMQTIAAWKTEYQKNCRV